MWAKSSFSSVGSRAVQSLCGVGGIRTLGTGYPVQQFSKLSHSTTLPPLHTLGALLRLRSATRRPSMAVADLRHPCLSEEVGFEPTRPVKA